MKTIKIYFFMVFVFFSSLTYATSETDFKNISVDYQDLISKSTNSVLTELEILPILSRFSNFIIKYPDSIEAEKSLFLSAGLLGKISRHKDAIGFYKELIRTKPQSFLLSDLYYQIAINFREINSESFAKETIEEFLNRKGINKNQQRRLPDILLLYTEILLKQNDLVKANEVIVTLQQDYPSFCKTGRAQKIIESAGK